MEVDQEKNCYVCRGFGHIAHHCRNRGRGRVEQGKRLEYERGGFKSNIKQIGHLKEMENLEPLN